jgi:hypothetical protein
VRNRIERLVDGPYLELFARETAPGWDCWGNEAGLFDQGTVATRRQPSSLSKVKRVTPSDFSIQGALPGFLSEDLS